MAANQTSSDIEYLLSRLNRQQILALQVLGINSLKSMTATPEALAGQAITSTSVVGRVFTIATANHRVTFDLQRTGKLVWLTSAESYVMAPGTSRPTVRLILADGQGFDLTEPAKTKRITVTISAQSEGNIASSPAGRPASEELL